MLIYEYSSFLEWGIFTCKECCSYSTYHHHLLCLTVLSLSPSETHTKAYTLNFESTVVPLQSTVSSSHWPPEVGAPMVSTCFQMADCLFSHSHISPSALMLHVKSRIFLTRNACALEKDLVQRNCPTWVNYVSLHCMYFIYKIKIHHNKLIYREV